LLPRRWQGLKVDDAMSFDPFNFVRRKHLPPPPGGRTEIVQTQRALRRILSFTGKSIDDVVNDPIAKRLVLGYYKLDVWVDREIEVGDLERQWTRPH